MDTETLKSLGTLLIFGALFFLMNFGLVFVPLYNFFHGAR